jgi:hypothetical protein
MAAVASDHGQGNANSALARKHQSPSKRIAEQTLQQDINHIM